MEEGSSVASVPSVRDKVIRVCKELAGPLVAADGGQLYVVTATNEDVHFHLAGTCAGCPGATMTRDTLLTPAVSLVLPKASVKVTTGWRVPPGAERV